MLYERLLLLIVKHTLHMLLLSIEMKPRLNLLYKHEYLLDKIAKQMNEVMINLRID